jgi:hypothetical protein
MEVIHKRGMNFDLKDKGIIEKFVCKERRIIEEVIILGLCYSIEFVSKIERIKCGSILALRLLL